MRMLLGVLIFFVSVFAQEEIGIPYIPKGVGQIDSAVLSPDGKSFYTLKDELISQWQLNPIKKIMSFKASLKSVSEKYSGLNIHITSDQTKMIISSKEEIQLWDLKTKKLIHKKKIKSVWGLIHGDVFITIDEMQNIVKWDTKSLNIIKRVYINELSVPHFLVQRGNVLVCVNNFQLLTLDIETLKVLDKIQVYGNLYLSIDQKYFYYNVQVKVSNKWQLESRKLNIETGEKSKISNDWSKNITKSLLARASFFKFPPMIESWSNDYLLTYTKLKVTSVSKPEYRYGLFNIKTRKLIGTFLQFENDEGLFISPDGKFQATKDVSKYIKMKMTTRKVVPINEETYNKYNKDLILSMIMKTL